MLDGRLYQLNVWTFDYLHTVASRDASLGINGHGQYVMPPDLFVRELSRPCIERTIVELLNLGHLDEWRNTSIFGLRYMKPWQDARTLADAGRSYHRRLLQQMHPQHPLCSCTREEEPNGELSVLAIHEDEERVLFELSEAGTLAEVNFAQQASFGPETTFYNSPRAFWEQVLAPDQYRT